MADALRRGAMPHPPQLSVPTAHPLRARSHRVPAATLALALGTWLWLVPGTASAQQQSGTPGTSLPPSAAGRPLATRGELDSLAKALDSEADTTRDAAARQTKQERARLVRARLAEGDFRVGDRLFVSVSGPMPVSDTVSVRTGDSITVKGITDVTLAGVLRSELEPTISAAVAKLVRGSVVRAGPLLWMAVLGGVQKPGFYAMPPDVLLGDALMRAGGPAPQADLGHTEIVRNGAKLYDREYVRTVLAQGITLDQLALHSGDQIVVGEKKPKSFTTILQASVAIISLAFGIYGISRR